MREIIIDFETYSDEDIATGTVKYAMHLSTDIICMAYKVDDELTQIWLPGQEFPKVFSKPHIIIAHNALFEYCIWNFVGVRRYKLPALQLQNMRDSMALANRYTLPNKLQDAGTILGLKIQKDRRGAALIKKICVPTKHKLRPEIGDDFTYVDMRDFLDYCRTDVETTYALIKALPASTLTEQEQQYWVLTQKMNLTGLPIDTESAAKILGYIENYAEEMTLEVPKLTNGLVQKVTQVKAMREYMQGLGVYCDNLTAETVDRLLAQPNLPETVRRLLELRQILGRSSTAKYRKLLDLEYHGIVYNNLQYYGASTGRWTGRGFQMHNLPRASVPDPEAYIEKFRNFEVVEDPVNVAKALIRPMICAPPGQKLIVADYSSIENYVLMWLADDQAALKLLASGGDQYKDMASFLYQTPEDSITKRQRQIGKIIILGCGYGMGAKRFLETSAAWGVELSEAEAYSAVHAYRDKYKLVSQLWKRLSSCAVAAIRSPGHAFKTNRCAFKAVKDRTGRPWMVLTLPSGRNLFYMEPYISYDDYGAVPAHKGTNPYSKAWGNLALIPGRITENIVQALARDLMAHGLLTVTQEMPEVTLLGTVHDEGIGSIADEYVVEDVVEKFCQKLCKLPKWAEGLPLKAEGYISQRYKK